MTNIWHKISVEHGWHDNDELTPPHGWRRRAVALLDRLRTRLCRGGEPSARQKLAWVALIMSEWGELSECIANREKNRVENGKPLGPISEMVDVWIRCADYLEACGVSFDCARHISEQTPIELLTEAVEAARKGERWGYAKALLKLMDRMKRQCSHEEWEKWLKLKTDYNETRPYRHGGRLA